MNIRKKLNIPNSSQRSLIESEKQIIGNLIIERQTQKEQETKEMNHRHNFNCPKCGNSSEKTIVNRIADVSGGKFYTNTAPVNHCNKCGNEWHKGNYSTSSVFKLIEYWSKVISMDKLIPFGLEKFSAEAIKLAFHEWDTRISLRILRKKFYSVYDKKA